MGSKKKDNNFNSNRRDFLKAAGIGATALTLQGFAGSADAATELSHTQKVLSQYKHSDITQIAMLGTGTPNPDPSCSGPCTAIVVRDTPYIVDFGPGLIRRAASLSPMYGKDVKIKGLLLNRIARAFLTHMHSDHTAGYADLILTPWVMGRSEPLQVYGPEGINEMTEYLLKAYNEDIKYRLFGYEPANDQGYRVHSKEIFGDGLIYKDANVEVEAFRVKHGNWPNAFGFRFTTPDKVIVISGDTCPCENIKKFSEGADILIHEVYSMEGFEKKDEYWKNYHSANHTSTYELGELASEINPDLLVTYHTLFWGASEEKVLNEIAEKYSGKTVVAADLDVF